jgi:hypothetical protein
MMKEMRHIEDEGSADATSASEVSASRLAFLFANVAEAGDATFSSATWSDLGNAGTAIRSVIADQNIDLTDPEVGVTIYTIKYDANRSAAFVDVSYSGGGTAPDPFRFVYFVSSGKYIGFAGDVAS